MFIISSWAYCIFYVQSLCRQASYLYIKQRYNPSNIYISQPCWHMNLLNGLTFIVWEPFHGTLYHESILTPALPPMHCIPIKALSMNRYCTQTSAILVVY